MTDGEMIVAVQRARARHAHLKVAFVWAAVWTAREEGSARSMVHQEGGCTGSGEAGTVGAGLASGRLRLALRHPDRDRRGGPRIVVDDHVGDQAAHMVAARATAQLYHTERAALPGVTP